MMDQKNLFVAMVLMVAILFGFQYLSSKFFPPPAHPTPAQNT